MGDLIRLVALGVAGVGKSALTIQYCNGNFIEKYDPTIEESYRKVTEIDSQAVNLEILDTAGTDQFAAMRDMYIQRGDGFIMVYSVSSEQSPDRLRELHRQISRLCESKKYGMVVVGNKCDLPNEAKLVPIGKGKQIAKEFNCPFYETSAKLNYNVATVFEDAAKQVMQLRSALDGKKKKRKFMCYIS